MKKTIYIIFSAFLSLTGCQSHADKKKQASTNYSVTHRQGDAEKLTKNESILEVAYIGNMGVLLEVGEKTILFDGLHEEYKPAYQFPSEITVSQLINEEYQGFNAIEISLVTHIHRDHFSPTLNKKLLEKNGESILIGSQQITSSVHEILSEKELQLIKQVHTVPNDSTLSRFFHKGIEVRSIKCDHTNQARHRSIENTAYVVTLNNYSILHVGDTYWDVGLDAFEYLKMHKEKIDVAILPYWMLNEPNSREMVLNLINPKKIIATHIPPNFNTTASDALVREYANIIVFTEPNEKTVIRLLD